MSRSRRWTSLLPRQPTPILSPGLNGGRGLNFYKGNASFHFLYSDSPKGMYCAEDAEHDVEVSFTQREWSEHHPYGSTFATETLCEVDDDSLRYKLDGKEVSLDDLQERFGAEWINTRLEAAQNDAELTELREEVDDEPY